MPAGVKNPESRTWNKLAAWLTHPDAGKRAFLILLIVPAVIFFVIGGIVAAVVVLALGGFTLWQSPERTARHGVALMRRLVNSFAGERGRFTWVLAFWLLALSFLGIWTAYVIALLAFAAYWTYFAEFLKAAFKNEWPYNFLAALGALMLYCFTGFSSVFSNYTISSITGFHAAQFPSSATILSTSFMFFAIFLAFTVIAGLAAVATGFSSRTAARIAPIAFMLAVPGLASLTGSIGRDQDIIALAEAIIISVDFNQNARFENGSYVANDGMHVFGTKVCRGLPFETLVMPHSDGGYITATLRLKPAVLADTEKSRVMATKYIYHFIEQKDCPAIQELVDEPEIVIPKVEPQPSHQ